MEKYPVPNDTQPSRAPGLGPLLSTSRPTGIPAIYIPRFPKVPYANETHIQPFRNVSCSLSGCSGSRRASSSLRMRAPTLSMHTANSVRSRQLLQWEYLTFVPHASEMTVAATTDTTLAVLNLFSDMAAEPDDSLLGSLPGGHRCVAASG